MLRSELYDIGYWIQSLLEQGAGTQAAHPADLSYFKKLCAKIENNWTARIFSAAREQIIIRYIRFHQAGVTQLSDRINGVAEAKNLPAVFPELLAELEKLLIFLRSQCYMYFDVDHKVSDYFGKQQSKEILVLLERLSVTWPASVSPDLLNVFHGDIKAWVNEGLHLDISYRRLSLIKGTLSMIAGELLQPAGTSTAEIIYILFRRNFNTPRFVSWLKKRYAFLSSELEAEVEHLSGIQVNFNDRFEPELPSVDLQMLAWLRPAGEQPSGQVPQNESAADGQMSLVLSVPQFAMFIRVFQKNGCFPERNAASIMRFFTLHFSSKKQGRISIKSFNHAFYSRDQVTAAIVLDYLQRMTGYVNKFYFPK